MQHEDPLIFTPAQKAYLDGYQRPDDRTPATEADIRALFELPASTPSIVFVGVPVTVGEYRTFGDHGPAYQVSDIDLLKKTAQLLVLHRGEMVEVSLDHVARDPMAD